MLPIRIVHVIDNLGRGGLQNGLVNLIERLDADRFEHVICTTRHLQHVNAHHFSNKRIQVISVGCKEPSRLRTQIPGLLRVIRETRPHIVHSRNWSAIEAVIAGRLSRSCAVVHSEHGFDGAANEPRRRTWFRRVAFELADRVLCVSKQLRQLHAETTGFSEDRITVIRNGVDTKKFCVNPKARARMRQELAIPPEDFCIGCVGNLTPVKDYMTLLRAVDIFAGRCRAWRLVIVGEGAEQLKLEAFVSSHPEWSDRVSFVGLSDRVPELLNSFDVYVLTSVIEGICNSLLEAMATGLPVIATATGGNPEVVVDDESGFLFPVGDYQRLGELFASVESRKDVRFQSGVRALRRVHAEFSMDPMVRKYEQLYDSLSSGPNREHTTAVGRRCAPMNSARRKTGEQEYK